MTMNVPGYETLANILQRAYNQAAIGKGADRHASALPFDQQPMQAIADKHGVGFLLGQADKKINEAHGMLRRFENAKATHELLGAINYISGAILHTERQLTAQADTAPTPKPDRPFKVGDRVRIAEKIDKREYEVGGPSWADEMDQTFGQLGTVMKIDKSDETARIGVGNNTWWYFLSDLTRVPETEAEAEECDCPACKLRKYFDATKVTIVLEEGDDSTTTESAIQNLKEVIEKALGK